MPNRHCTMENSRTHDGSRAPSFRSGAVLLPPAETISRRLIDSWLERGRLIDVPAPDRLESASAVRTAARGQPGRTPRKSPPRRWITGRMYLASWPVGILSPRAPGWPRWRTDGLRPSPIFVTRPRRRLACVRAVNWSCAFSTAACPRMRSPGALAADQSQYAGFNLIVGDRDQLIYVSNRTPAVRPVAGAGTSWPLQPPTGHALAEGHAGIARTAQPRRFRAGHGGAVVRCVAGTTNRQCRWRQSDRRPALASQFGPVHLARSNSARAPPRCCGGTVRITPASRSDALRHGRADRPLANHAFHSTALPGLVHEGRKVRIDGTDVHVGRCTRRVSRSISPVWTAPCAKTSLPSSASSATASSRTSTRK